MSNTRRFDGACPGAQVCQRTCRLAGWSRCRKYLHLRGLATIGTYRLRYQGCRAFKDSDGIKRDGVGMALRSFTGWRHWWARAMRRLCHCQCLFQNITQPGLRILTRVVMVCRYILHDLRALFISPITAVVVGRSIKEFTGVLLRGEHRTAIPMLDQFRGGMPLPRSLFLLLRSLKNRNRLREACFTILLCFLDAD